MAYRFKLEEPVAKGVRRMSRQQLERVLVHLQAVADVATSVADKSAHIHEARKGLKRTRALLRLVRSGLPQDVFAAENARLKEVADSVAGARERDVLAAALERLAPVLESPRAVQALRVALLQPAACVEAVDRPAPQDGIRLAEAALSSLVGLDVVGDGLDVVEAGLARCFRQCRRAYHQANSSGDAEAYHEWRKTVQWHWRHMQLLSPVWPEFCKARQKAARHVSEALGDDHDLAQLAALARATAITKPARLKIIQVIEGQQAALRTAAALDGQRLLADRPKALAHHIRTYWHATSCF